MRKGQNTNHPKPGAEIKVEPIRSARDIKAIKRLLADNPRDYALFILGINTNLRASDLLTLRVEQVRGIVAGQDIELKEQKTSKKRRITLNKGCVDAIQALLSQRDSEPLFSGQRGPLTVPSVNRLVKQWCSQVNLKGNYGSHTLRKTWGYHQRVTFGRGTAELMVCFNHSTERQTLDYHCVQPEEIKSINMNEL